MDFQREEIRFEEDFEPGHSPCGNAYFLWDGVKGARLLNRQWIVEEIERLNQMLADNPE